VLPVVSAVLMLLLGGFMLYSGAAVFYR
jgi:hypothetical protein